MALTTAERNKRKRERKKRERAEAQKLQQQQLEEEAANKSQKDDDDDDDGVEVGAAVIGSSQSGRLHASVALHNHCPPMQSHSTELNVSPQHVSLPIAQEDPSTEHTLLMMHSIIGAVLAMLLEDGGVVAVILPKLVVGAPETAATLDVGESVSTGGRPTLLPDPSVTPLLSPSFPLESSPLGLDVGLPSIISPPRRSPGSVPDPSLALESLASPSVALPPPDSPPAVLLPLVDPDPSPVSPSVSSEPLFPPLLPVAPSTTSTGPPVPPPLVPEVVGVESPPSLVPFAVIPVPVVAFTVIPVPVVVPLVVVPAKKESASVRLDAGLLSPSLVVGVGEGMIFP
mmetsp:Transcript_22549/g.38421  ORF Transcript_22549/g.38421 Transcript_22549/m.38421 type:complete len:342 (-) Transcript_22549:400-1425(-)